MNALQDRKLDSLRRAQQYLAVNEADLGPVGSSECRRQLDAAIEAVEACAHAQAVVERRMEGRLSSKRALTLDLRNRHLMPIKLFARARLRGSPAFAALALSVARLNGPALVTAARGFSMAAAPLLDELTRSGFPPNVLTQLDECADALDRAITTRASMRVERVGATSGIAQHLATGLEALAMLHAAITRQFADDSGFRAGWHAARRVQAKSGAVRVPPSERVGTSEFGPASLAPSAPG